MADAPYVPLRPIALKQRAGIIFLRYGALDVIGYADGVIVPTWIEHDLLHAFE